MKLRVSGEQNVYCDIHRYLSGSRLLDTSGHVKVTDSESVKNYKLSHCLLLNLDILEISTSLLLFGILCLRCMVY